MLNVQNIKFTVFELRFPGPTILSKHFKGKYTLKRLNEY